MQKLVEVEIGGINLKIETKKWAKQSNGSAVLTYKDNVLLVTANMKDEAKESQDFFPLMVDFRESNYAAGKIPGGYFKREGKPSEREVLLSRLVDRPIRPLFPKGFLAETQVIATLLSADFSANYDAMGIIGASAALLSSTIPFYTPVAAIKLVYENECFIVNPGVDKLIDPEMEIVVAGTATDVVMLEASGKEFSEDLLKKGLIYAQEIIKDICEAQKVLINPDKIAVVINPDDETVFNRLKTKYEKELKTAIFQKDRVEKNKQLKDLYTNAVEGLTEETEIKRYHRILHELEAVIFRSVMVAEKKRTDGRQFSEIRNISIDLGVLPRTHGSAIFTRGETQSLATITLGAEDDAQRMDSLSGNGGELRRFMLHYNFPPFSVGEVSFLRGTGRREIGHGNLAEKSIIKVMPNEEKFPYTVRIVSDILESNGSSSMATVCSSTLALLNAGVPISAPVAGIAMGLVKENNEFVVLTDIAGYEDHFGDMDFKIAGTEKGITAVQLDIKINGLSDDIINQTLEDAKKARLFILGKMKEKIAGPSEKLSIHAPVILTLKINPEKIKDLIGPGGKIIKGLIAAYGVKINADDDGKVTIAAANKEVGEKVLEEVRGLTASVEIGKIYKGKIVRIEEYGVFVEILNGTVGLVHISELTHHRLRSIKDENFKLGQIMEVKAIDMERDNRIKLSRRVLLPRPADSHDQDENNSKQRPRPNRP
jgi:polyribonucleotide nucleotidyltransferase